MGLRMAALSSIQLPIVSMLSVAREVSHDSNLEAGRRRWVPVRGQRSGARAIVTVAGNPLADPGAKWGVRIASDFEKECIVRRERPNEILEEFDCEHLSVSIQEVLAKFRQPE